MKRIGVISITVLFMFLGIINTVYAQQEQHEKESRPAQQGQHTQQAQQARPAPQQHPQQAQQNRPAQQGQHAQRGQQVAGNHGGRIPDDRFRANFGHAHMFRINRPTIVGGASRFQYGGYWFGFGQPWPVGWYYTDDVYVDYIDGGYFLYDPVHPGLRISINIL
jgi:hypothetical protein